MSPQALPSFTDAADTSSQTLSLRKDSKGGAGELTRAAFIASPPPGPGGYYLPCLLHLYHVAQAARADVYITRPSVQHHTAMLYIYLEATIGASGRVADIVTILGRAHTYITTSAHR